MRRVVGWAAALTTLLDFTYLAITLLADSLYFRRFVLGFTCCFALLTVLTVLYLILTLRTLIYMLLLL